MFDIVPEVFVAAPDVTLAPETFPLDSASWDETEVMNWFDEYVDPSGVSI